MIRLFAGFRAKIKQQCKILGVPLRIQCYFPFFLIYYLHLALALECTGNEDCSARWPEAFCVRGRCKCPADTVRKTSPSRGWICLAVLDASTGQIGSALTCPLPFGAGYGVIRREGSRPVYCASRQTAKSQNNGSTSACPHGYECIPGHGIPLPLDGVCCPNQETSCSQPIFEHEDGILNRWAWDGNGCHELSWNPARPSTANNFLTKEQCESYCVHDSL
ncbi:unnamed protein product, partial [Mesorhabditis spiculigera]